MTRHWGLSLAALLLSAGIGCPRDAPQQSGPQPLQVFAGIAPLAYLVERVGGEHVAVGVLMPAGRDPHTFETTPRQMQALAKARLLFKAGMPFEDQLVKKVRGLHRRLTVVDTARGIRKRTMEAAFAHAGHHDHDHGHHAGEPDPHVWLAPRLVKTQATNVAWALVDADPAHADDYARNLAALLADLDATDARIRRALRPHRGRSFYVFHPAFGYFGDSYGLKQVAVQTEGKPPTPRQLRALVKRAKADGVRIIFAQPQFDRRTAQVVASAIGGTVVPINPLEKNVLKNLDEMAAKIEMALQKQ